ncbi:MAG: hypothetical protein ACPLYF_05255 [Fervidobacterium sp.]
MGRATIVAQIYTIIAYGFSIYLWSLIPQVGLLEGIPFYLVHPYFTAELFLMMSTLIVWTIALIISLIDSLKQGISIIKKASQNFPEIIALFITMIAAISGCIFYLTKVVYYSPINDCPSTLPNYGGEFVNSKFE